MAERDARAHWEERYSAPVWSGKVNATLAETVAPFAPGRSLDLGCGEGGDVLWLAERGWQATGLDLSTRAIARARAEAAARGLDDGAGRTAPDPSRPDPTGSDPTGSDSTGSDPTGSDPTGSDSTGSDSTGSDSTGSDSPGPDSPGSGSPRGSARFEARDLATWEPEPGSAELVTASFFHSEVALGREAILRRAATALVPGGHLVVLSHAAPPPWASGLHDHAERMLSAAEEAARLALDPALFEVVVARQRERHATTPDGRSGRLEDSLLVVRRR